MKRLTLFFAFILLATASLLAQAPQPNPKNLNWTPIGQGGVRADPDLFLQGNFVEIGIAPGGSCGSYAAIPGGYHAFYSRLGFVADFQLDGWAVGTPPQSGDYFMPGYPWEGWLLQFTFQGSDYNFVNCDATGDYGIAQTSLTNTSAGANNSAVWIGTAFGGGQSIEVTQNFHFTDNDAKFMIDVTLKNVGSQPVENVEYARVVDPDQEVDLGGDFTTSNFVKHQPESGNNLAMAVGNGLNWGIPCGLLMYHSTAKASVNPSTLDYRNPNDILDFTNAPTEGAPYIADVGLGVACRIPVLNPGQSVTIPVAYVLNENEIINPPARTPVSNWAIAIMVGLIVVFTIVRFRRMN